VNDHALPFHPLGLCGLCGCKGYCHQQKPNSLLTSADLRSSYVIQSVNLTFGVDSTNPPGCICESDETMLAAAECTSTDNQKLSASFVDPFVPPPNERWMVWSVNATIWGRFNCLNDSDGGANLLLFLGQAVIGFTSNDTATPLAPGCECPACAVPFEIRSDPSVVDDLTGTRRDCDAITPHHSTFFFQVGLALYITTSPASTQFCCSPTLAARATAW
jgi:hypothetical protein